MLDSPGDFMPFQIKMVGPLLVRLRQERGLTQDRLAELSKVDNETIARVEQSRGKAWRAATTRKVFEALCALGPMSRADREEWAEATGMLVPPPAAAGSVFHAASNDPNGYRGVHDMVDAAVARLGVTAVRGALAALLAATQEQQDPAAAANGGVDTPRRRAL